MNLARQRKNIEAAISAEDALYKSVDQATTQGANVATFASNAASGGSASSDSLPGAPDALAQWQATGGVGSSIQSQLKQYLSQTRAFTGDVKKLKAEGLDQTSLTQLLQAGVSGGGLSGAKMLLSGGPKGVQEVASLQNQISQAAKQLGTTGANAAYESGSQIDGGLASGLKSELGSVTAAIKSLATSIVDEMRKDCRRRRWSIGKDGRRRSPRAWRAAARAEVAAVAVAALMRRRSSPTLAAAVAGRQSTSPGHRRHGDRAGRADLHAAARAAEHGHRPATTGDAGLSARPPGPAFAPTPSPAGTVVADNAGVIVARSRLPRFPHLRQRCLVAAGFQEHAVADLALIGLAVPLMRASSPA